MADRTASVPDPASRWLRGHKALPAVLFLPTAAVCLVWGAWHGTVAWPGVTALAAAGLLAWTLTEYVLHRWVFHHAPHSRFVLGYVAYDSLHYACHHHRPRRLPLGRRLQGYHLRHHFRDDTSGFGVTTRLWARVLGTLPRPDRSPAGTAQAQAAIAGTTTAPGEITRSKATGASARRTGTTRADEPASPEAGP